MNFKNPRFAVLLLVIATAFCIFFSSCSKTGNPEPTVTATQDSSNDATSEKAAEETVTAEQKTQVAKETQTEKKPQPAGETAAAVSADTVYQMGDTADGKITIGFTGDINLDENWAEGPMQYLDKNGGGISTFIDPDLIGMMKAADIMFVNNEFTYSERGTKQSKKYTFRANPANVKIMQELGVDIVSIANNHIFDYREDAMKDTISTLNSAGIACVGGGENLAEAMKPVYYKINGKTIAFVAASRSEAWLSTPVAGKNSMGILDAYGSGNCVNAIKAAAAKSDYVFVYVHWGTEYANNASSEQLTESRKYIDAGANAVIGSHPHVLQGMDFYKGKFIDYSLGNFWFNMKDLESGYLELIIDGNGNIEPHFIPCMQTGGKTYIETDLVKRGEIIKLIEDSSPRRNIGISENGIVTVK